MQVTIKDVAKKAGVSPSTVSRVIANSSKISDATKERVMATMKEMNYQPNIIARSLANRRTYTLGLILPCKDMEVFDNPFFIQAMRGLSMYAQQKGYYIMYNYCQTEDEEVETINRYIDSKWVDGVILTATRINDRCVARLRERHHPFVVIGRPEEDRDKSLWVDNDNVAIMEQVVSKLIEQGHRKIAFVGGGHEFTVNRHRMRGYRRALEVKGIEYNPDLVVEDDPTEEKAYQSMKKMLQTVRPEAIVGTDDVAAYGAMRAVQEAGYDDVAVAGFNNTPVSLLNTPSMSTVDINAEQLGHKAAELLIDFIEKKPLDKHHMIIDANYIERQTTLDYTR